jgi:hypothetical protein
MDCGATPILYLLRIIMLDDWYTRHILFRNILACYEPLLSSRMLSICRNAIIYQRIHRYYDCIWRPGVYTFLAITSGQMRDEPR